MSLLLITTPNVCEFSAGGIRKVILTNHSDIKGVLFTDDNFNLITGFEYPGGSEAFWLLYETTNEGTRLQETLINDSAGDTYDIEFKANLVFLKEQHRAFMEELTVNKLSAVVEDNNGRFWFIGEDAPVTLTSYEAKTDNAGGVSEYNITLGLRSRYKMREVSAAAAATLPVLVTDCSAYAGFQIVAVPGAIGLYYNCAIQDFF